MLPRQTDRWRWHLKVALASAITGACRLQHHATRARQLRRPLVVGYHRVVEDFAEAARTEMPSMLIGRAMFERHIEWLGRSFRFVSLDEVGEHLSSGRPFRDPVAAITFDDGYRDVYEHALPILRKKGIPAAMFVVTDLVGERRWQIHDKLYHLFEKAFTTWDNPGRRLVELFGDLRTLPAEAFSARTGAASSMLAVSALLPALPQAEVMKLIACLETAVGNGATNIPPSLSWPMIEDLRRAGCTIGSHTRTHISLPAERTEVVVAELEGSKRELERHLGEAINHFAYPGGHFTPAVVEALHRVGYRFGYTACPHRDDRYPALTIERLLLWEGSSIDADGRFAPAVFNCQVHNLWPPARRCERLHFA